MSDVSWVQPLGDEGRRVDIPHATAASQVWTVDGAYTFFEGRTYPVGARSQNVTSQWQVTTSWGFGDRPQAEAFLGLLRSVTLEVDARLEVHIEASPNGTAADFVGEAHDIPQDIGASGTDISVTFQQVDS